MRRLNVVLAPRGPLGSIRSVLADWAAAGIIDDFVWAEPKGLEQNDIHTLVIADGTVRGGTLRNIVADRSPQRITLCVLVPILDDADAVSATDELAVAQILESAMGGVVDRIRCVISRPGVSRSRGQIAREGWHNVVLAPEDRASALSPAVLLTDAEDRRALGMHGALGLAGVVGLWQGADAPAVSGPPGPGQTARLAASYYRELQPGDTEAELRNAVLSMGRGLPRPQGPSGLTVYVSDPGRSTLAMAHAWWAKHRSSLIGHRDQIHQEPRKPVNWRTAIVEFFRFLAAALRNAPGEWLAKKNRDAKAGFARRVTNAVYGQQSAYTVVADGITGDGTPASWLELGRAVGAVESALDSAQVGSGQHSVGDLGALWNDFCAGALTLADGQARVNGLEPDRVNVDIGIVRDPAMIAPPASAAFRDFPGQLSVVLDIKEIDPCDVLGAYNVEQKLDRHARESDIQLEVSSTHARLREWRASVQNSFGVRVAELIGKAQIDVQGEIQQYLKMLTDSGDADSGRDEARQRALGRRLRLVTILLVVLVVAVGVVTGLGLVAVGIGIGVGVVVLVTGMAGMARTFYTQQRHVFQMLHRRAEMEAASEVAVRNLRSALHDLRRLTEAYGQLLVWAPVVASFLAAPFGRSDQARHNAVELAGPFPRGLRIGIVESDARERDITVNELRRDVYAVGWLSRPWENLINDAQQRVGPGAPDTVGDNPRALYGKQSTAWMDPGDSLLAVWGELIVKEGPSRSGGEELWAGVLDSLGSTRRGLADRLMSGIRLVGGGPYQDIATFFEGTGEDGNVVDNMIDQTLLGDTAATRGAGAVVSQVRHTRAVGLGRVTTLTQFSGSVQHYEFRVAGTDLPVEDVGEMTAGNEYKPPPMPGYPSGESRRR